MFLQYLMHAKGKKEGGNPPFSVLETLINVDMVYQE